MNRARKEEVALEFKDMFAQSEATFVVEYKSIDVPSMQRLRRDLRAKNASLRVTKARLMKKAFQGVPEAAEFLKDLKAIYQANTLAEAEYALQYFADKWGKKYAQSVGTWVNNWHEIATLFEFKPPLRKLMYTTNSIEAYHRQQRRILKTKSAFVNEEALKKLLFLNMQNITQTWNKNTTQWKAILNELVDYFGDRVEKYINSF